MGKYCSHVGGNGKHVWAIKESSMYISTSSSQNVIFTAINLRSTAHVCISLDHDGMSNQHVALRTVGCSPAERSIDSTAPLTIQSSIIIHQASGLACGHVCTSAPVFMQMRAVECLCSSMRMHVTLRKCVCVCQ